jgi:CheY-like chemotaxis protein
VGDFWCEGLECIQTVAPDALLLDLHLPDILGLTIFSELRRRGIRTPVILTTGWYLDTDHEAVALALGAAGFLRKPLMFDEVAQLLNRVVHHSRDVAESTAVIRNYSAARISQARPEVITPRRSALQVHKELVGDDVDGLAFEQLCSTLLPQVCRALAIAFRGVPPEYAHDAAVDAILEYQTKASLYDSTRGRSLLQWVLFAARRNLLNLLGHHRRRFLREVSISQEHVSRLRSAGSPSLRMEMRDTIRAAVEGMGAAEREMLLLWIEGERRTSVLAVVAGVADGDQADRAHRVKAVKDRFRQRLRRMNRRRP